MSRTRGSILLPLGRVATHRVHWHGKPRAYLLDAVLRFPPACRCVEWRLESLLDCFGFFGGAADSDDGVRAGGRLTAFPLPVGTLAASPGNSSSPPLQDTVPSVRALSGMPEMAVVRVRIGVAIGQAVVVLKLEKSHRRVRRTVVRNKTRRLSFDAPLCLSCRSHECKW